MPQKGPHISLAPERLVKRVLGLPLEEFQTWPEYLQQLALDLAEELFIIRYNPFIDPKLVKKSVFSRLDSERAALTTEYYRELKGCLTRFWKGFELDQAFKAKLVARLRGFLEAHQVVTAPNNLMECSTDATDLRMELPAAVVFPETTQQVQAIVRLANEMSFPIVPRGGGSGLTGGAVPAKPRTVIVSLSRLKSILDINPKARTITVQSGVITLTAIQAAAKRGLLLTVDPASKAASSVGGNVAENAGGPFAFEYGTTLDNILAYRMVLPSGEAIHVRRKDHPWHKILPDETAIFEVFDEYGAIKETVALKGEDIRGPGLGKDVTNKFLGGLPGVQKEGVDGIITEITFILHPKPAYSRVLCLEFYGDSMHNAMLVITQVVALRDAIRRQGDAVKLSALEEFGIKYVQAIDYSKKSKKFDGIPISVLIIQLDSDDEFALDEAAENVVAIARNYPGVDVFVARDAQEAEVFWHDRHQLSAIAKRTSGFKINEDIVIPLTAIPEFADFLEELNLHYLALAYRDALRAVQALPGVDGDDEFIRMEMDVAAGILRGKTSKADLPEQQFELQTFYFFQHLKGKYPKRTEEISKIFEEMQATRIIVANHMHAGDGNCHVNLPVNSNNPRMLARAEEAVEKIFHKATELGGQVSGEHGIGITKIAFLAEEKIAALRAYKRKVDPNNIFNPGKLTQRDLVVVPYTFSFNRLIQDITKTALPGKEKLIALLTNIQTCTRCGKCKQVCPMYLPQKGLLFHPRNKNITLGALVEAIYYSQLHHGEPEARLLRELRRILEHCTACGKCFAICPVKIRTQDVTLHLRTYLEDKGMGGHPFKNRVLHLLAQDPQKTLPKVAKLAGIGAMAQDKAVRLLPASWRSRLTHPMLRTATPQLEFRNLSQTLGLARHNIFTPKEGGSAAVLYFPGCGASLFYRSIGLAAVRLLLGAGVTVVLAPEHLCCGYPLLASGCREAFERVGQTNQKILEKTLAQAQSAGFAVSAVLTACGTCREGIHGYRLRGAGSTEMEHMDVTQWIVRQAAWTAPSPGPLLYHAACHQEWTGAPALKAADLYAAALTRLTGAKVHISPYCCAESGLGAMSSPAIYNRLRARKSDQLAQDLADYPADRPIVVGCPSCRIGIARCLGEMGVSRSVLHTVEFLAQSLDGPGWAKDILRRIRAASSRGGVCTVAMK
ncbi:MAG: FAD-binding oxidoreductase [Desulfomicrobiaceae bacterium]|nr:FAD-binding oxidoreductase [Desulfomicrobiaceae bacterium]